MRTRLALTASVAAATALALVPAEAAPPAPQVTDQAGDANFSGMAVDPAQPTPGSQDYADVLSVTWAPVTTTTVVKRRKVTTVTGFTVTTVLSAPPVPAPGTSLVYRMLGVPGGVEGQFLGPVYYTDKSSDPGIPQAALRDNLTGVTRLTPIDLPKIEGSTITWTVPKTALPKEFKPTTPLTDLYFEVNEIEDFQGAQVPAGVPTFGGAYGLGTGQVDGGTSTSTYLIG